MVLLPKLVLGHSSFYKVPAGIIHSPKHQLGLLEGLACFVRSLPNVLVQADLAVLIAHPGMFGIHQENVPKTQILGANLRNLWTEGMPDHEANPLKYLPPICLYGRKLHLFIGESLRTQCIGEKKSDALATKVVNLT